MPAKGQGRRSRDLPQFSSEDLLAFLDWLEVRRQQLERALLVSRRIARIADTQPARNAVTYNRSAERAARWIMLQLRFVVRGRLAQEERAADAVGRPAE